MAEIPSLFQFPRQPHPVEGGEDVEIRTRNATLLNGADVYGLLGTLTVYTLVIHWN